VAKSKLIQAAEEAQASIVDLAHKRAIAKRDEANRRLKAELDEAMRLLAATEAERDILLGLSDRANAKAWAKPVRVDRGEAAAMFVISDVHIAEVVRPSQVLGLNEFNQHVVARRLEQVATRGLMLTEKERKLADIREAVVFLGGDVIGGKLHADQVECNDLGIVGSIGLAEELLEKMLRTWWTKGGFERMTVVCLSGNHDRLSPKVQHASFYENSYASTIYLHLRKRFTDEPKVQWVLGDGEYADVPIFGWNFRLTHGHRVKFNGGIGGLSIPWTKHVMRLNKGKHADFTIGGHLHTWTYNAEAGFLVNGSVIGTTPYSLPLGHQRPEQSFLVVDRERCVTQVSKIFCE
jgi:predicted phosphodiesterase